MNVIFLDFDGVLGTDYYVTIEQIEVKIKILKEICDMYNCKIVISSGLKSVIDIETLTTDEGHEELQQILYLMKKYKIPVIGKTRNVTKVISELGPIDMWKEDEIRLYLFHHPEIEHYCVIDDDDMPYYIRNHSDLNKVRKHLVQTIYYSLNPEEEGLLEKHKEEVGKVLELDNDIKKLILLKERKKAK